MKTVKWSDIATEAGSYKDGFVAVFQKYEGMPTDKVVRGKQIMVTEKSFADHFGIDRHTFARWVQVATDPAYSTPAAKAARTAASHGNVVKNMARSSAADLADSILKAGPAAADQVFHELRQRRHAIPRLTHADRKANHASIDALGETITRTATGDILFAMMVPVLEEMAEKIEEGVSTATVTTATLEKIEDAANRLLNTVVAGKAFV